MDTMKIHCHSSLKNPLSMELLLPFFKDSVTKFIRGYFWAFYSIFFVLCVHSFINITFFIISFLVSL